jgi:hypothetical protein
LSVKDAETALKVRRRLKEIIDTTTFGFLSFFSSTYNVTASNTP